MTFPTLNSKWQRYNDIRIYMYREVNLMYLNNDMYIQSNYKVQKH